MNRRTRLRAARVVPAKFGILMLSAAAAWAGGSPPPAVKIQAVTVASPGKMTPASFTPEMPFGEAIDILRNSTTPPLNLVVLWREIGENAGVYRETPIGIDGVPGLRVRQYLDMLVASLSAGALARLGYAVHDGVITLGTTDALPRPRRVTRVYDISDLVTEPARYFLPPMGFGGLGYGGGPMRGPIGAYGGGYMPGVPYASPRVGDRGLSGAIGGLYRATAPRGTPRR